MILKKENFWIVLIYFLFFIFKIEIRESTVQFLSSRPGHLYDHSVSVDIVVHCRHSCTDYDVIVIELSYEDSLLAADFDNFLVFDGPDDVEAIIRILRFIVYAQLRSDVCQTFVFL